MMNWNKEDHILDGALLSPISNPLLHSQRESKTILILILLRTFSCRICQSVLLRAARFPLALSCARTSASLPGRSLLDTLMLRTAKIAELNSDLLAAASTYSVAGL